MTDGGRRLRARQLGAAPEQLLDEERIAAGVLAQRGGGVRGESARLRPADHRCHRVSVDPLERHRLDRQRSMQVGETSDEWMTLVDIGVAICHDQRAARSA